MYNQQFYLNQNQISKNGIIEEAFIDKLKDEVNLEIGFDWNLLKRDELYVNLIHFDKCITNKENYGYYNKFKVDVVGGYLAMDNIYMLHKYLEALKNKKNSIYCIIFGFWRKRSYSNLSKISIYKRSYYFLCKL